MPRTQKNLEKEAREIYQNLSEEEDIKRWKKAQGRYRNLSEKVKEKKRQYYCERNQKLSKGKKLVEYMRNCYLAHKE